MKRIQFLIACVFFLFSHCMATANPARFARVATQAAAAAARKGPPRVAHPSELAYYAAQAHAQFPEHRAALDGACEHFHATPGFLKVITLLVRHGNPSSARGYWYEVQKALALHHEHASEKNQTVVTAFGKVIASPDDSSKREFDIVAIIDGKPVWIECKAVNWNCYRPNQTGNQFLDQREIAGAHKAAYQVSSKKDITPNWHNFFNRHGIQAEVDPCEYETR